jgi:hypothetical protein
MISTSLAACAALACAALATTPAWAITVNTPPGPTLPKPVPPISPPAGLRSFAYVIGLGGSTPAGEPVQEVRIAYLDSVGPPRAHDVKTLQTNVSPSEDVILGRLFASPGNARVVMESTVIPFDGFDINYQAYNLSSRANEGFFNDETAWSMIDRAHCPSPAFDAYLAAEKAAGLTDADLALYDFQIDNQNFNAPSQVAWVDDTVLYVRWTFDIYSRTKGAMSPAPETFDLQIKMSSNPVTLVSCHAPASLGTPPAPIHVLSPGGAGPAQTIRLDKTAVAFKKPLVKRPSQRTAVVAAGNIPK